MRIAVIADIHGNMPALEAVLADVRRPRHRSDHQLVIASLARPGHVKSATPAGECQSRRPSSSRFNRGTGGTAPMEVASINSANCGSRMPSISVLLKVTWTL